MEFPTTAMNPRLEAEQLGLSLALLQFWFFSY